MRALITGAGGFIGRTLTRSLLAQGSLAGPDGRPRPITELVLVDRAPFSAQSAASVRIVQKIGDLRDESFFDDCFADGVDSVFHLAATLTIEAETDFEAGWAINMQLPHRLLEACRKSGRRPRFVYASSIATFGGPLPERVSEAQAQTPQTSYGVAKVITEQLINDYSRHGHVDGRALRLPIVLIRDGAPSRAVSDIIAGLAREPLNGESVQSPLPADARYPVVSVDTVAANMIRVHDLPADVFGVSRALNQPGLTVSTADVVAALGRVGGPEVAARVSYAPDPAVEAVVASWPTEFVSDAPLDPPLLADPDFDAVIQSYLAARQGKPAI